MIADVAGRIAMETPDQGLGSPVSRQEVCSLAATRRVAAMLDLDQDSFSEGDPLPRGWQFVMMGADTPRSRLRADGFPGLGVAMPDLGLPRLMLGGRTVDYQGDIPIGCQVTRTSFVRSLTHKSGASGPFAVAVIEHELRILGHEDPAIVETQSYLLMSGKGRPGNSQDRMEKVQAAVTKTVTPDSTLLFQYSALGFNSHKIHLDAAYARDVEGFPDLVVNGGLATLLLTEFARSELQLNLRTLKAKHTAPLYCGRPLTLAADRIEEAWQLRVHDDMGRIAVMADVQ
jgi:3-methylfumaryl-CoA hydratase